MISVQVVSRRNAFFDHFIADFRWIADLRGPRLFGDICEMFRQYFSALSPPFVRPPLLLPPSRSFSSPKFLEVLEKNTCLLENNMLALSRTYLSRILGRPSGLVNGCHQRDHVLIRASPWRLRTTGSLLSAVKFRVVIGERFCLHHTSFCLRQGVLRSFPTAGHRAVGKLQLEQPFLFALQDSRFYR